MTPKGAELRYFDFGTTDRAMVVLHEESPFTAEVGLELDAELDHDRLGRALALLARRHPILRATLDPTATPACWQPDRTAPRLTDGIDDRDLDPVVGPTCRLVHLAEDRSRLAFGVHHAVSDGRGILMMLDDLRRFYVALGDDPLPVADVDWSPRTLAALLHPGPVERARLTLEVLQRWTAAPRSTHRDAFTRRPSGARDRQPHDACMRFDDELVGVIDAAARRRGWRLNHVMLALLARAWSRVVGREPVDPSVSGWLVTVDCRRQLDVERGAGNLSGLEPVSLLDIEARDTVDLIEHVRQAFAAFATPSAGLVAELMTTPGVRLPADVLDRAMRDTFALRTRTSRYSRMYSHTDRLPPSLEDWGHARATGLRWMPPNHIAPPYVAMVLVRFAGTTTITPFASSETLPADAAAALEAEVRAGLEEVAGRL
jgi:hypothetical protein